MKKVFTILGIVAILAIVFVSCKKSSANLTIQGNWELTRTSAMAGVRDFPSGNGNSYQFNGNNYSKYVGGALEASGKFSIVKNDSASVSRLAGYITFENPTSTNWFYMLDDNTLVIDFGSAADGPINTYRKK